MKFIFPSLPSAGSGCRSFWEKILIGSCSIGELAEGLWERAGRLYNQWHPAIIGHFLSEKLHPEMFLSLVILQRIALGRSSLFNHEGSPGCSAHFPVT